MENIREFLVNICNTFTNIRTSSSNNTWNEEYDILDILEFQPLELSNQCKKNNLNYNYWDWYHIKKPNVCHYENV